VRLNYLLDEPGTKGSGAALVSAYKKGLISSDETLLIYYGDILSTVNLTDLLRQHEKNVQSLHSSPHTGTKCLSESLRQMERELSIGPKNLSSHSTWVSVCWLSNPVY